MLSEGRFWRVLPLMLVAHALQTTWLAPLRLGVAQLDLPFLVALATALWGGVGRGALAGAGAGYLAGLAALWHPGSFLVSRLVPCLVVGALAPRVRVTNFFAPILAAALGALLADAFYVLLSPGDLPWKYWRVHAPESVLLHALAIWPVFWLVGRVVRPPKQLMFG